MTDKIAILLLTVAESPAADSTLLTLVDGLDMMTRATRCVCSTGILVFVTISTESMDLARAISQETVTIVPVPRDHKGVAGALRAGFRSLPEGLDGVVIMHADLAKLTPEDLGILLTHFAELGAQRVVCATDGTGHPGYPMILPARLFGRAEKLAPDQSALNLYQDQNVSLVRLRNGHARTDINRPQNWVAWRAGRTIRRVPE